MMYAPSYAAVMERPFRGLKKKMLEILTWKTATSVHLILKEQILKH